MPRDKQVNFLSETEAKKASVKRFGRYSVTIISASLLVSLVAVAGSLTPPGTPASTMRTLQEVYDTVVGPFDSSLITADQDGSVIQGLKYISGNLSWASSSNNVYNLNSGNVGIGTTVPNAPLEVSDSASNNGIRITSGAGASALNLYTTDATAGNRNWRIANRFSALGSLDFMYSSTLGGTPNLFAMSINNAGNVGIGTISPETKFELAGTASISSITGSVFTGISDCDAETQTLNWDATTGRFSCLLDSAGLRAEESGVEILAAPNIFNFDGGKFSLTASAASEVGINLDWGAGGPASLSQNENVTGAWTFTTNPTFTGGARLVSSNSLDFDEFENAMDLDANTTVTNNGFSLTFQNASVSSDFEVGSNVLTVRGNTVSFGVSASHSITGDLTLSDDFSFFGELLPDGATCANGQILKKMGPDDWDCAPDSTGGGGGSLHPFREGSVGAFTNVSSVSFEADSFNLTFPVESGNVIALIKLDWGPGGPASLSQNETVTGFWNFTGGASFSGPTEFTNTASFSSVTIGGLTINTNNFRPASNSLDWDEFTNAMTLDASTTTALNGNTLTFGGLSLFGTNASVSGNFEVLGNASASQTFGSGLTDCDMAGQKLLWDLTTGRFSCSTDLQGSGGSAVGLREGFTGSFTNFSSISFNAPHFVLDTGNPDARLSLDWGAGGPASLSQNETVTGSWTFAANTTFSAGASMAGNFDPAVDNTYDLGDTSFRWKSVNVGPGSFNLTSTTGTSGAGTNYTLGQISFPIGSSMSLGTQAVGTGNAGSVELRTNNLARLFVGSGGNIGVGTTSPASLFNVNGGHFTLSPFSGAATGEMRFQELTSNGTNYSAFKASISLAGNTVWTLPAADGTSGQVLRTDGSGNLSWVTGSGGSGMTNPMTNTGDLIYGSTASSPSTPARLQIGANGQCLVVTAGLPSWQNCAADPISTPAGADTQVQFNNGGVFGADPAFTWNNGAGDKSLTLSTSKVGEYMPLFLRNTSSNATSTTEFYVGNDAAADTLAFVVNSSTFTGAANQASITNRQAAALTLGTNDTERIRIDSAGNVGVGTTIPGALFAVGPTSQFQVSNTGLITGTGGLTITGSVSLNTSGVNPVTIGGGSNVVTIDSNTWDVNGGFLSGLLGLTNTGVLTTSGGVINLAVNDGINNGVNIATGTSANTVSIGGGLNLVGIDTSTWDLSSLGVLTGLTGITSANGAISLNADSGANTTAIGTGSTTGAVSIGGGAGTVAINTTTWDVSSAGAISGVSTLNAAGLITGTGGLTIASGSVNLLVGSSAGTAINIGTAGSNNPITIGGGANIIAINSSNWGITVPGAATFSTLTSSGLITGNNGLTIASGAFNVLVNAGTGAAINVGTGSSTSPITIGGGTNTIAINSSNWDVSSAGAATGFTSITSSGLITGNNGLTVASGSVNLLVNNLVGGMAINIGTGTSISPVTIGGNSNTVAIDSNAWDISALGVVTGLTGITNTGTLTSTGGTINLNASTSFATNIGTGNTTGAISIGGGQNTSVIDTSDWDISTAGVMTGISGITTNGAYTQSGSNINSFTGNVGIGTASPVSAFNINGGHITLSPFSGGAGNTGQLRFQELNANGLDYVGFKAPDSITAGNTIWTLPDADGTNGQILQTNGAGILSWTANVAASTSMANPMTITGDLIYGSTTGAPSTPARLGIGTAGQCLVVSGGLPAWGTCPSGSASVAGSNGQVQFNNAGAFGADPAFSWDNTDKTLSLAFNPVSNATYVPLVLRQSTAGTGRDTELQIGNDIASASLTLTMRSSTYSGRSNFADIHNELAGGVLTLGAGSSNPNTAEKVRIESSGNVGIGTTAPLTLLDVNGVISAALGSVTSPSFAFRTDRDTGMWSSVGNTINFSTAGSERVRINNVGNVGIGTTTVGALLAVGSTAQFEVDSEGNAFAPIGASGAGNLSYSFVNDTDTGIYRGANTNEMRFQTLGVDRMTIIQSGNVGIGTTDPANMFAVGTASQFQVSSTGAVTTSGGIVNLNVASPFAVNILTGASGAGTVNIKNGSGTGDINIGNGTSTGAITIGNTANTTAITSGTGGSAWSATAAGVLNAQGINLTGNAANNTTALNISDGDIDVNLDNLLNRQIRFAPGTSGSQVRIGDGTGIGQIFIGNPSNALQLTGGSIGVSPGTGTTQWSISQAGLLTINATGGLALNTLASGIRVVNTSTVINNSGSANTIIGGSSVNSVEALTGTNTGRIDIGGGNSTGVINIGSGFTGSGGVNINSQPEITGGWHITAAGAFATFGTVTLKGDFNASNGTNGDINIGNNATSGGTNTINICTGTCVKAVHISDGTGSGTVSIGGGSNTLAINTSDWDITTTGIMTGIGNITTNGGYTQSGTTDNIFTGMSTFSNSTFSALFTGGFVGIGTTNPTAILGLGSGADRTIKVEVRTTAALGRDLTVVAGAAGTGGTGFAGGQLNLNGGAAAGSTSAVGGNVQLLGGLGITGGATGSVILQGTGTGNVGIGTTGPGSKLQVDGNTALGYSTSTVGPANGLAVNGNVGIGTITPVSKLNIVGGHITLSPFSTGAGNTGQFRFQELAANGTDYVGFKAPDSILTATMWTLPSADGTVGQILQTNGAGILSWTANSASGMANPMTTTGDIIYGSTTGSPSTPSRLGIGAVGQCLVVSGGLPAWGSCVGTASAAGSPGQVQFNSAGLFGADSAFSWDNDATDKTLTLNLSKAGIYIPLALRNPNTGTTSTTELRMGNDTAADTLALSVNSSTNTTAPGVNGASIFNRQAAALTFGTNNLERMRIDSAGNVGIGSVTPGAKLNVVGTVTTTGGTVSLNDSSNFAVNLGTGTNNTAVNIGGSSGDVVINSDTWDVSSTGAMTGVTTLNTTGLITGTGGATISGAAINLGVSSNFPINIGTGTNFPLADITIGNTAGATNDLALFSATWSITAPGVASGLTGLTSTGGNINLNVGGGTATTNIGTGATTGQVTIGANNNPISINSNDWDISTTGVMTGISGITNNSTIDSTGGIINLNVDSNFAVNIKTGTSTGALNLGGGAGTVVVDSTSWDVSSTGAITGVTTLTTSGVITSNGGITNTTGAVTLNSGGNAIDIGTALSSTGGITLGNQVAGGVNTVNIRTSGWKVISSAISGVTTFSSSGLMTLTGGLNASGNPIDINSAGSALNIGTGTQSGAITIGNGTPTIAINSSAWDISTAGAFTGVTTFNASGLITGTAGINISGSTVNINSAGNTLNIGTGTQTGAMTIGANTATLAINTSDWDIDSTGVMTGIGNITTNGNITTTGDITTSGGYTQTGTTANTFSGTTTFSRSTVAAVFSTGNVGIGTTAPGERFAVGTTSQFQVNSTGNILRINDVATSFPATQGVANSVLKNNGSGNLSWADPAGTGIVGYWTRTGTSLYPSNIGDNVGIGTTGPVSRLDVRAPNVITAGSTFGNLNVIATDSAADDMGGSITLGGNFSGTSTQIVFGSIEGRKTPASGGTSRGYLIFKTNRLGALTERMRIDDNGNVGIGTTDPGARFAVGTASQFKVNSTGNIVLLNNVVTSFPATQGVANSVLENDGAGNLTWADPAGTGAVGYWQRNGTSLAPTNIGDNVGIGTTTAVNLLNVSGTGGGIGLVNTGGGSWNFQIDGVGALRFNANQASPGGDAHMTIDDNSGNVGIGTTTTTIAKLRVEGNISASLQATAGDHAVLGARTITAGTGLSGGGALTGNLTINSSWTASSGTNIFNNNAGNVGIGQDTPLAKLHVTGSFITENGLASINSGVGVTGDVAILTGSATGSLVIGVADTTSVTINGNLWSVIGGNIHTDTNIDADGNITALGTVTANTLVGSCNIDISISGTTSSDSGTPHTHTFSDTGSDGECADYAEVYHSSEPVYPGDLVAFDPMDPDPSHVKKATIDNAHNIMGIVSTTPAAIIGNDQFVSGEMASLYHNQNEPAVALVGRVPLKASLENGPISMGDHLTASSVPGVAMKATEAGMTVGVAMWSPETNASGQTTVLTFVNVGYWAPNVASVLEGSLDPLMILGTTEGKRFTLTTLFNFVLGQFEKIGISFGNGTIKAKQFCVEDTCINQDQLKALLENAGVMQTNSPSPSPSPSPSSSDSSGSTASPSPSPTPSETPTEEPDTDPTAQGGEPLTESPSADESTPEDTSAPVSEPEPESAPESETDAAPSSEVTP